MDTFPPSLPIEDKKHETMLGASLNTDGYFSFPFQLLYYFTIGLVLSPFSYGFGFYLISSIFSESWYAYKIKGVYTPNHLFYRFGLFCVGLMGFLIGRTIVLGDRYPLRAKYEQGICEKQLEEDYKNLKLKRKS